MTPVCPACRGQLSLDAYRCPRCGLAVRPTCSECGEALTAGIDACWRCAAPIEQAPIVSDYAVAPASPATAVLEAPAYVAVHAPPARARRSRHRVRRFVLLPVLLTVVLALALLAYEVGAPRPRPVDASGVLLNERSLPRSFRVDVPLRWEFVVDGGTSVFTDPDQPGSSHGMRIVKSDEPLAKVKTKLAKIDADLVSDYEPVRTVTAEIDGRPALRHDFTGTDTVYQQWWVARGKGTFRIDMFARPDFADEARTLDERIVATFHEL